MVLIRQKLYKNRVKTAPFIDSYAARRTKYFLHIPLEGPNIFRHYWLYWFEELKIISQAYGYKIDKTFSSFFSGKALLPEWNVVQIDATKRKPQKTYQKIDMNLNRKRASFEIVVTHNCHECLVICHFCHYQIVSGNVKIILTS